MKLVGKILLGLAALVGFMLVRTVVLLPAGTPVTLKEPAVEQSTIDRVAARLSKAITYRTISWSYAQAPDAFAFNGFHKFLADTYPLAHQTMELEKVSEYSLMYRWPAAKLGDKQPIAFMAHIDVVPVPEHGLAKWTHAPFEGVIDDNGVLWGRGAMDDKAMLITLMEAAETLIADGFQPDRDIYFLFGHDEELGGAKGAVVMADMLKSRNVELEWAVDEGSAMVQGVVPGVQSPMALISLGEKGFVTLRFSAEDEGGHSSAPKSYTAASLAARAGARVMDNPHPLEMDGFLEQFLLSVAPEMNFTSRFAAANMWLTRPLLTAGLANNSATAAFMHTTTAFTMMKSGIKPNILPQYGEVIVNYRVHPRDTVAGVVARAKEVIDDERVTVTQFGGKEATRMSSVDSEGYSMIAETVKEVFGDIPTAPTLTVQGTDGRHYYGVAKDVYRFMPFVFQPTDLKRIHGTDEAVDIVSLARQVDFFEALIKRAAE